jgi:hypothetical protein
VTVLPYFTRQPYGLSEAVAAMPSDAVLAEPDIMHLAETVLGEAGGAGEGAFRARHAVKAGEFARIKLQFASDSGAGALSLRFAADEMTGAGGIIPAAALSIEPPSATLRSDTSAVVTVSIAVPASIAPGTYEGRLRVTGDERFDETLSVKVIG